VTLNITDNQRGISHFTIIKILKKLSVKEMNEFEKMVKSPFFNNHTTLVKLFSELKKYYPQFADKNITKEYLFQIVNRGKKYDDKLFRKYLSRLNKLAEEYLNILQTRLENCRKELNVLLQLSRRDVNEAFSRKLKEVEKSIERENKIDGDSYLLKHQLYTLKYNHETTGKNITSKNEDLIESYDNLVNYFLFFSGSFLTQVDSNQYSYRSTEDKYSFNILLDSDKIEEYIEKIKKLRNTGNMDRIFFFEIILNDLKMNSPDNGLNSFKNLRTLVYDNSDKLSDQMLYYLLQRMNVFCILESAKGNLDMNSEIFKNYKMLLDKDLFNKDNTAVLSLLDFRIILSSALKNNEYDWAEKFINEKVNLLKEELRINVRYFGNAVLLFYKKNYPGALEQISRIKSESHPVTVDIYILKLKIFYMLGHYDSAVSVEDSFRHFVSGNKLLSDFHKVTLLNFLKYYKSIIRLTLKPDVSKLKKLLSEIDSSTNTKEKKWMTEITGDLLKSE